RGDELGRARAATIGVVPELPVAGVVDHAVVGIVAAAGAGRGVEAAVGRAEIARGPERGHDARIQVDLVRTRDEVADLRRVRRAGCDGEEEAVRAIATPEGVVAARAVQRVIARAGTEIVGGGVAGQDVVEFVAIAAGG